MGMREQRKVGLILSYIVMASNFAIGLVYTPYLIRCLGPSEYGTYNYVNSVVQYLTLLTCGFGSAYLKFASPYKHNKDEEGIANVNGLFLFLFIIMGTIALLVGAVMTINSEALLAGKLTVAELQTGKKLMLILVINVFMSFPISVFNSFVIANERFVFQKTLALISSVITPVVSAICLYCGQRAIGLALCALCVNLFINTSTVLFCIFKLKMRFGFKNLQRDIIREVFVFSSFLLLSMVVDQINWSLDKFILGKVCGTAAVAIYTVGATINSYYMSIGEAISNVYVPTVYQLLSKQDGDREASKLMTRLGRVQFCVLMLIITGFITFGKEFVLLWVGADYEDSYYIIIILMASVTIPEIQKIGLEIQKAKNLHKFRSMVYIIIALVNIVITIPLAKFLGPVGSAIGTAITVIVGNGIVMNIYYYKVVHVDIPRFWSEVSKLFPAVIGVLLVGIGVKSVITISSWLTLSCGILLYTGLYIVIVYNFALNKSEKKEVLRLLHKN